MAEGFDRKSSERLLEQARAAASAIPLHMCLLDHAEATTANYYKDPMKEASPGSKALATIAYPTPSMSPDGACPPAESRSAFLRNPETEMCECVL